ncbi:hypothetical protein DUNSADRAFT_1873 [Dunaliella salina]|uniref:Uncharacterized protein n=1 Tax=Dunaliella salina TaxID=3046 RepID=A0ABQ7FWY5_DUNSA|nr:hypothetical protein DUNSADRAFT_1873 [Dunaliella salina]|eukprot:KAF5826858.1 hypothetical protein DUNSADRAFT_1873 [Dunaliella salina]
MAEAPHFIASENPESKVVDVMAAEHTVAHSSMENQLPAGTPPKHVGHAGLGYSPDIDPYTESAQGNEAEEANDMSRRDVLDSSDDLGGSVGDVVGGYSAGASMEGVEAEASADKNSNRGPVSSEKSMEPGIIGGEDQAAKESFQGSGDASNTAAAASATGSEVDSQAGSGAAGSGAGGRKQDSRFGMSKLSGKARGGIGKLPGELEEASVDALPGGPSQIATHHSHPAYAQVAYPSAQAPAAQDTQQIGQGGGVSAWSGFQPREGDASCYASTVKGKAVPYILDHYYAGTAPGTAAYQVATALKGSFESPGSAPQAETMPPPDTYPRSGGKFPDPVSFSMQHPGGSENGQSELVREGISAPQGIQDATGTTLYGGQHTVKQQHDSSQSAP